VVSVEIYKLKNPKISIVIPILNEGKNMGKLV
jgi:glycosyltransferase involved in cell wall biosynthesis